MWLKTEARAPPASLPCRPGHQMLGAEEEKESNVTLKKGTRESCMNVITYFHEIIRVHYNVETYTYHHKGQPKREVGGCMKKRHRIETSKVSPESIRSDMSRQAGQG